MTGTGDDQVYKKDLDDLIDYITGSSTTEKGTTEAKKQKKKKTKKNKDGAAGDNEALGEVGGTN